MVRRSGVKLKSCFDFKVVDKVLCAPIEEVRCEDTKGESAEKKKPQGFEKVVKEIARKIDLLPSRLYWLRRLHLWFHMSTSMLTEWRKEHKRHIRA